MTTGLTFAEAYVLSKAKEAAEAQRRSDPRTLVSNIDDLHDTLRKLTQEIEGDATLKRIKHTLQAIPPNFTRHITDWTDDNKLDLLHHAILSNRPTLVTYLLSDTNYFPAKHAPQCNPYAHLAAMTGHIECLRPVLHHRPGSFFPNEKPSHQIKLPEYILRKLRLTERPYTTKTSEKLLEKIKSCTKDAEKKMNQASASASTDIADVLDRDMGNLDKSFQKKKKRVAQLPIPRKSVDVSKRASLAGDVTKKLPEVSKHRPSTVKTLSISLPTQLPPRVSFMGKQDSQRAKTPVMKPKVKQRAEYNHFTPRLKRRSGKHLITVYWDIMSRFDQGVVRGAGSPVEVDYTPRCHTKPQPPSLSMDEIISILSWPSLSKESSSEMLVRKVSTIGTSPQAKKESVGLKPHVKRVELGVRGVKKYKDFQVMLPSKDVREREDRDGYLSKTPLTLAAERGHEDCVQLILDMVIMKRNPTIASTDALTLATKAGSPETIMLLLEKSFSREDFQNAVLLAIREMYPVCLTALLSKGRGRTSLFESTNLFHILYSQCVVSGHRFELMPQMTRALIACKEDVNAHSVPRTFPMYTLINCAFNISIGKQIFFFIECLNILLENRANPHFDEEKQSKLTQRGAVKFSRSAFSSAVSCVFGSAKGSVKFFEKPYWSKLFMKKFITTIEMYDRTPRRVLNAVLFEYMNAVCELGLDRTIVRCLLRYGANPDHLWQGKYAVNVYFDKVLPYMTKFEISGSYHYYRQELDTLMVVCRNMSFSHLSQCLFMFLQDHLLSAPIQALPITRQFAALMDAMTRTPRPLVELSARVIWVQVRRNKSRLKSLPITEDCIHLVIP